MRFGARDRAPDEDKGKTIHATVEADPGADRACLPNCRRRSAGEKSCPCTVEFVETPMRDEAGKVRRAARAPKRVPH